MSQRMPVRWNLLRTSQHQGLFLQPKPPSAGRFWKWSVDASKNLREKRWSVIFEAWVLFLFHRFPFAKMQHVIQKNKITVRSLLPPPPLPASAHRSPVHRRKGRAWSKLNPASPKRFQWFAHFLKCREAWLTGLQQGSRLPKDPPYTVGVLSVGFALLCKASGVLQFAGQDTDFHSSRHFLKQSLKTRIQPNGGSAPMLTQNPFTWAGNVPGRHPLCVNIRLK